MTRYVLALLLLLAPLGAGAHVNLAEAPISRMDLPWWNQRFHETLAEARQHPDAQLIWLGDSITQYWQRTGKDGYDDILPVWNKYYARYDALDFGFIGDTTSSLIWRLDHGQVDGLHPKLTVILIGANNLGRVHWGAEMTVPGIEAVVTNVRHRLPESHILLLGILPSIRSQWVDEQTVAINSALARHYADNKAVTFINVGPVLMTNGHVDPNLYVDTREVPPRPALHPDATGMARIAAFIQPEIEAYLP